eukprot:TRINITY_DN1542_c1_g2_i1.p1 TRINITY_DN1542_c1_g2~~TRINITY_DN1542_c1_g2_i1.p1  ORF type:complete len:3840 (+),score=1092.53 TRINITY_DN1542_c1_g2_i1:330-11522(+)
MAADSARQQQSPSPGPFGTPRGVDRAAALEPGGSPPPAAYSSPHRGVVRGGVARRVPVEVVSRSGPWQPAAGSAPPAAAAAGGGAMRLGGGPFQHPLCTPAQSWGSGQGTPGANGAPVPAPPTSAPQFRALQLSALDRVQQPAAPPPSPPPPKVPHNTAVHELPRSPKGGSPPQPPQEPLPAPAAAAELPPPAAAAAEWSFGAAESPMTRAQGRLGGTEVHASACGSSSVSQPESAPSAQRRGSLGMRQRRASLSSRGRCGAAAAEPAPRPPRELRSPQFAAHPAVHSGSEDEHVSMVSSGAGSGNRGECPGGSEPYRDNSFRSHGRASPFTAGRASTGGRRQSVSAGRVDDFRHCARKLWKLGDGTSGHPDQEAVLQWIQMTSTEELLGLYKERTLLFIAARQGNVEVLRALIGRGLLQEKPKGRVIDHGLGDEVLGDLEEEQLPPGASPLYTACQQGHCLCVYVLVRGHHPRGAGVVDHGTHHHPASVFDAALAAEGSHGAMVLKTLRQTPSREPDPEFSDGWCPDISPSGMGARPGGRRWSTNYRDCLYTELHAAVLCENQLEAVQEIRNVLAEWGRRGRGELARLVNARDPHGATALHWAAHLARLGEPTRTTAQRRKSVLESLDTRNQRSETRLEVLLQHADGICDTNLKDRDGWTPLHWAVMEDDAKLVALLIEAGADCHQPLTRAMIRDGTLLTGWWQGPDEARCIHICGRTPWPKNDYVTRRSAFPLATFEVQITVFENIPGSPRRGLPERRKYQTAETMATLIRFVHYNGAQPQRMEHLVLFREAGDREDAEVSLERSMTQASALQSDDEAGGPRWCVARYDPLRRLIEPWTEGVTHFRVPPSTSTVAGGHVPLGSGLLRPDAITSPLLPEDQRRFSGADSALGDVPVAQAETERRGVELVKDDMHLDGRMSDSLLAELGISSDGRMSHVASGAGILSGRDLAEARVDPRTPWDAWDVFTADLERDRAEGEETWRRWTTGRVHVTNWDNAPQRFFKKRFRSLMHVACENAQHLVIQAFMQTGRYAPKTQAAPERAGPALLRRLDNRGFSPFAALLYNLATTLKTNFVSDKGYQRAVLAVADLFQTLPSHEYFGGSKGRGWHVWSSMVVLPTFLASEVWPTGLGLGSAHYRQVAAGYFRHDEGLTAALVCKATQAQVEQEVQGILAFLLHSENHWGTVCSRVRKGTQRLRETKMPEFFREVAGPKGSGGWVTVVPDRLYARLLHGVHCVCASGNVLLLDRLKTFITTNAMPDILPSEKDAATESSFATAPLARDGADHGADGGAEFSRVLQEAFRSADKLIHRTDESNGSALLKLFALRMQRARQSDNALLVATACDRLLAMRHILERWCPGSAGVRTTLGNDSLGHKLIKRAINHQAKSVAEWLITDGGVRVDDDTDEIVDIHLYQDAPPSSWEVDLFIQHRVFQDPAKTWDKLLGYSHLWAGPRGFRLGGRCWSELEEADEGEGRACRVFLRSVPATGLKILLAILNLDMSESSGMVKVKDGKADDPVEFCTEEDVEELIAPKDSDAQQDDDEEEHAGSSLHLTRQLFMRGVIIIQFATREDLERAARLVETTNSEWGMNIITIDQVQITRILRDLFQIPGVDIAHEIMMSDRNRLLDGFDFGSFNDSMRVGYVFLLLVKKVSSQVVQDTAAKDFQKGFIINGIEFTPEDYPALCFPFHLLCIRAHRRNSAQAEHLNSLAYRFAEFINKFLADAKQNEEDLLHFAEAIAIRTPADFERQLPTKTRVHWTKLVSNQVLAVRRSRVPRDGDRAARRHVLNESSAYYDRLPIEMAIELHQVQTLRSMLDIGERASSGFWKTPSGKVRNGETEPRSVRHHEVEVCGGRRGTERYTITAYNDHWFPPNHEFVDRDGVHYMFPTDPGQWHKSHHWHSNRARRPLLHLALSLLTPRREPRDDIAVERWERKQPHLAVRAPGAQGWHGQGIGALPHFAPSSGASWSQMDATDPRNTRPGEHAHDVEDQRREVVKVLLSSILPRNSFPQDEIGGGSKARIENAKLPPTPQYQPTYNTKCKRPLNHKLNVQCISRYWDRVGLFATSFYGSWVRLRSPYLRMTQQGGQIELAWYASGLPADAPSGKQDPARGTSRASTPRTNTPKATPRRAAEQKVFTRPVRPSDIILYSGEAPITYSKNEAWFDADAKAIVINLERPVEVSAYEVDFSSGSGRRTTAGGDAGELPWQLRWTLEGAEDDLRDEKGKPWLPRAARDEFSSSGKHAQEALSQQQPTQHPGPFRTWHCVLRGQYAQKHLIHLHPDACYGESVDPVDGGEFGLSLLCARAPWWWGNEAIYNLLANVLVAHPCGYDMFALFWRMRLSHAPILIERRHQWGRCYRATAWAGKKHALDDSKPPADGDEHDLSQGQARRASVMLSAAAREFCGEQREASEYSSVGTDVNNAALAASPTAAGGRRRSSHGGRRRSSERHPSLDPAIIAEVSDDSVSSEDAAEAAGDRMLVTQPWLPEMDSATPSSWVEEPPGERDLIVDNGLTLLHWAALYGARSLLSIVTKQEAQRDATGKPLFLQLMEERTEGALVTSVQFRFRGSHKGENDILVSEVILYGEDVRTGPRGTWVTGTRQPVTNITRVWARVSASGGEVVPDDDFAKGPEVVVDAFRRRRGADSSGPVYWKCSRGQGVGKGFPVLQIDLARPTFITGYNLFSTTMSTTDKRWRKGIPTEWQVYGTTPPSSAAGGGVFGGREEYVDMGEQQLQLASDVLKVVRDPRRLLEHKEEEAEKIFNVAEELRESATRPEHRPTISTAYLDYSPLHYASYSCSVELVETFIDRMGEAEADFIDSRPALHSYPGQPFHQVEPHILESTGFADIMVKVVFFACHAVLTAWRKLRSAARDERKCTAMQTEVLEDGLAMLADAYPLEKRPSGRFAGHGPAARGTWTGAALRANLRGGCGGGGLPADKVYSPITAGDTALLVSAQFVHMFCVRELLQRDGDPCLRNWEGHDAHDVAVAVEERNKQQWNYKRLQKVHGVEDKDDTAVFEEQFRQLHNNAKVQHKLRTYALLNFFSNSIHLTLFIISVTAVALLFTNTWESFYAVRAIGELVNSKEQPLGSDKQWLEDLHDVGEISDIKDWYSKPFIEGVLLPTEEETFTAPPFQSGAFGLWRLVGPVRINQLQVTNNSCAVTGETYARYLHSQAANQSAWDVSPSRRGQYPCFATYGWDSLTPASRRQWQGDDTGIRYMPLRLTDHVYPNLVGEFIDVHRPNASCTAPPNLPCQPEGLDIVTQGNWITPATRLVTTSFVKYNPNMDQFIVGEVVFEILPQGTVLPNSRYLNVRLSFYQNGADYLRFSFELLWFCVYVWMALEELHELVQLGFEIAGRWGSMDSRCSTRVVLQKAWVLLVETYSHITSNWNFVDVTVLVMGGLTMSYHISAIRLQRFLRNDVDLLNQAKDARPQFIADFTVLAFYSQRERSLLGVMTGLAWIKFLKAWQLMPWVGPVVGAITGTVAEPKVITFFAVFIEVLVAILLTQHITFGYTDHQYRSIKESMLTTLRMVLGDWDFDTVEAHGVVGEAVFCVVIIVGQIILLNLVIAVIGEVYNEQIGNADNVWSRGLVETYLYNIISVPNPNSFMQAIGHGLRNCRRCQLVKMQEPMLKFPGLYRHSEKTKLPDKGCCRKKGVKPKPVRMPWREPPWETLSRMTRNRYDHEEQQADKTVYRVGEELAVQLDEVKAQIGKLKTDLGAAIRSVEKRLPASG